MVAPPKYDFRSSSSNTFICDVDACGKYAKGTGRSKNEAKHSVAADILRKFRLSTLIDKIVSDTVSTPFFTDFLARSKGMIAQDTHFAENLDALRNTSISTPNNYIGMLNTLCLNRNISEPM